MKISGVITTILIIGAIIFIMASMINEGQEKYDVEINKSNWENNYDYVNEINETIEPVNNALRIITDTSEDSGGWFYKLTTGIAAIPKAVIAIPSLGMSSAVYAKEIITSITTSLNIPAELIIILLVVISAWVIFKLVEFLQRKEI
ncbi:MAG: hypothetical protein ACFFHD_05625 [Promethearchaeota archaeon]